MWSLYVKSDTAVGVNNTSIFPASLSEEISAVEICYEYTIPRVGRTIKYLFAILYQALSETEHESALATLPVRRKT
jgi:hypothetical protein